jgi:uncharacterized protein with PIN domain
MKFIADAMLGRLAKRLRLLGFDVLYDRSLDDNAVIGHSIEEHRVILTRDKALAKRPLASNHIFITSEDTNRQLDEVLSIYPSADVRQLSRCSRCNSLLLPLPRQEAKELVPQYVFDTIKEFLQCGSCKRVYWKGTHVLKMKLKKC